MVFDQSGPRWLGISDLIAEPEGPTFISYKVARSRLDRLRFVTQDPNRTFLQRIGKGLQPGSLSQKQIDLVQKPSSGGFVLQKEMIPPGKRYEASTGDSGRHLTARFDRDDKIVTHMHDKRWHLHLREQFAHIEIAHDFKVARRALR